MNRFFGGAQRFPQSVNTGFTPYFRPPIPQASYGTYTPQMQNYAPAQQTVIPNQTNIIWVDNADQISTYPTGRGWQQWFGDKNDQILYVRDTDANGYIQSVVKLRYEVIEDPVQTAIQTVEQASPQVVNGPTREEFDKLSDSVNMLVDKLGDLLK